MGSTAGQRSSGAFEVARAPSLSLPAIIRHLSGVPWGGSSISWRLISSAAWRENNWAFVFQRQVYSRLSVCGLSGLRIIRAHSGLTKKLKRNIFTLIMHVKSMLMFDREIHSVKLMSRDGRG
ncbi:hypothetical protein AVEN_69572-1 [Araneus ventricosus]|uniref:Uncharacterized protein n=1 Tax=Araneus ventricosus TaxID=182803 RepID=A0A4Y2H9W4_ARAVE|nr:hypothetical protein AVEN_69572-1 [Araneus ventricosus]